MKMLTFSAAFLASVLAAPLPLVTMVHDAATKDKTFTVVLVDCESEFRPEAVGVNRDYLGRITSRDWRLFQLCDRWHNPFKDDLAKHIEYGAALVDWLFVRNDKRYIQTVAEYNTGSPVNAKGLRWGRAVVARYAVVERAAKGLLR
jgi:hypothetical protein